MRRELCSRVRSLSLGLLLPACNALLGIDETGVLVPDDTSGPCDGSAACGTGGRNSLAGSGGRIESDGGARASGGVDLASSGGHAGGDASAGSSGAGGVPDAGTDGGHDAREGGSVDAGDGEAAGGDSGSCGEGTLRCFAAGSPLRERCESSTWGPTPPCAGTPPTECFDPVCRQEGACDFEAKPPGTECSIGSCDARGQCVECLDVSTCDSPGDCHEAFCSTPDGSCGTRLKDRGASCGPLGAMRCDGAGTCVDCLAHSDCGEEEVCRTGACESAIEKVGSDVQGAGTESLDANVLYLIRLEPLARDARLLAFGVVGTDNATVKLVLYAEGGTVDSPRPTGGALSAVAQPMDLVPGESETRANPVYDFPAGTRLWLGIVAEQATVIGGTEPGSVQAIRRAMPFANAFPENPTGLTHASFAPSIYIKILNRS